MGLIQFGSDRAPSFDEPVEMLLACHGKIKRFCHELTLLPDYVAQHGWDDKVQVSSVKIVRYFEQAAPLHHLDEECDVFPALWPHFDADHQHQLNQLSDEHSLLEQKWHTISLQLSAKNLTLSSVLDFQESYHQHMAIEENLFPLTAKYWDEIQIRSIGQNMAARRQISKASVSVQRLTSTPNV